MSEILHIFAQWLATTQLSQAVRALQIDWPSIIPLLQSIHILAFAAMVWTAMTVDLKVFGILGLNETTAASAHRFLPWVWWAFIVCLISGSILVLGGPRKVDNYMFQVKMLLMIAGLSLTAVIQLAFRKDPMFWELTRSRRTSLKALALASGAIWMTAVVAGRWVAYLR